MIIRLIAAAALLPSLAGAALAGAPATPALPPVIVSPPAAAPSPAEVLRHDLMGLEIARINAFMHSDTVALESLLAEEFVHTNAHGGRMNRASALAFYKAGALSLDWVNMANAQASQYGDVATLTGTLEWSAIYKPKAGAPIDLSGAFDISRVYVKRDGSWRLALSHASKRP